MSGTAMLSLVTPRVPNFLRIEGTFGMVFIENLSMSELESVAKAWHDELIERAKYRAAQQTKSLPERS